MTAMWIYSRIYYIGALGILHLRWRSGQGLLTQWSPFTRLDQTLMTFGVSVGEQLLLAVDSAEMLHVACMESKGVVDLMAIPLFMEGGRRSGTKFRGMAEQPGSYSRNMS